MLKNAEKIVGRNGHKNDVSKNDPHSQREDKYWYLPDDVRLSDEDYEAWDENELNSSGWSGNSNNMRKKKLLRYNREELPEDTGSAKRLMPPDYDLKNELGPNNRYDTLAGLAHEYGYKYRDPSLVAKGLRLGELIRTIPYNHDGFYKVISLAASIERTIKSIKEALEYKENVFEIIIDPEKPRRNVVITAKPDILSYTESDVESGKEINFVIEIYTEYTTHSTDINVEKIHEAIINLMLKILGYDKRDLSRFKSEQFQYIEYSFYRDGALVYKQQIHTHNGAGRLHGYFERFYFDTKDKAEEIWQKVHEECGSKSGEEIIEESLIQQLRQKYSNKNIT